MWTRLRQLLTQILASTDIEASHDSIIYHVPERGGETHFSRPSSLHRYY
jgi:hypothetical protein